MIQCRVLAQPAMDTLLHLHHLEVELHFRNLTTLTRQMPLQLEELHLSSASSLHTRLHNLLSLPSSSSSHNSSLSTRLLPHSSRPHLLPMMLLLTQPTNLKKATTSLLQVMDMHKSNPQTSMLAQSPRPSG
jgi:hypothetical protein